MTVALRERGLYNDSVTTTLDIAETPQHIVLPGMSWAYYEQTLAEIGNRPIRVAYLDGVMEIMSPLPRHEYAKTAIGDLIAALASERNIPRKSLGSTTFRREDRAAGGEPDECFYFYDIAPVKGMERFDPLVHRAPDLWIEVDLFSTSVAREPIYARLGVPEVWRYSAKQLTVRLLTPEGGYSDSPASKAFPFLPMVEFAKFVPKMIDDDESRVIREFRDWVQKLPQ